jgi:hypothetical protein
MNRECLLPRFQKPAIYPIGAKLIQSILKHFNFIRPSSPRFRN